MAKLELLFLGVAGLALGGCSAAGSGDYRGVQDGGYDFHCVNRATLTTEEACHLAGSPDAGDQAPDYGDTQTGNQGYDDDCKYWVTWIATPVRQNADVTFTVTAEKAVERTAAVGASIDPEVFKDNHPAPNSNVKTTEAPLGTYTIGPVRFDQAGRWTVRFHLYHSCSDFDEQSPHGHAAFFVDVP